MYPDQTILKIKESSVIASQFDTCLLNLAPTECWWLVIVGMIETDFYGIECVVTGRPVRRPVTGHCSRLEESWPLTLPQFVLLLALVASPQPLQWPLSRPWCGECKYVMSILAFITTAVIPVKVVLMLARLLITLWFRARLHLCWWNVDIFIVSGKANC